MHQISTRSMHLSPSILTVLTITMLFGCSSGGGDSYTNLVTAIDCFNKAAYPHDDDQAESSDADRKEMLDYYRSALKSAKRIDVASMNKDYPTLGDRCKGELKKGLEWVLEGYKKNDEIEVMAGMALTQKFVDWYQSIKDEIRKSPMIDNK